VLRARFNAAFDRAIFLLWSEAPDQYQPLAAALNAPGASAHAFRLEWDAYRKYLIHEFEVKPLFGQEDPRISLSQLYVPLRAASPDTSALFPPTSRQTRSVGVQGKPPHVVILDEELRAWATGGPKRYELRLIGGGPGSGKSTTVKSIACQLAEHDECRTLFIPLGHIDPANTDLRDAINGYFTRRTGSSFRQPPLARSVVEDGPPLVLIFDGLDELARPGAAADEVARDFMLRLSQLTSELSGGRAYRLRVIVTGRIPSFQAGRRYAVAADTESYEVLGFLPIGSSKTTRSGDRDATPALLPLSSAERQLLEVDQRRIWWGRYAAAAECPIDPPAALLARETEPLTHEPLLCYLLVLSGYLNRENATSALHQNTIYQELIDEVWRRGWGDRPGDVRREGPGKNLTQEGFNRLMETIALAGWQGGDTRVCGEANFILATKILRTESYWQSFVRDNGPDMTNLAINFYLKMSDTESRGFEFTHKSFGDYLAARALLVAAFDISTLVGRRTDAALREWFSLTSPGRLSQELLHYMANEMRLIANNTGQERVSELKSRLEDLCSEVLRDGLPANSNADQPWRVADARQRNAEVILWAVLHACVSALSEHRNDARLGVSWPNEFAFADLLHRVQTQASKRGGDVSYSVSREARPKGKSRHSINLEGADPVMSCLSHLVARNANCIDMTIWGANLRNADLTGANLTNSKIQFCDFTGANLTNARLADASFHCVVLDGSNLENANLLDAKFDTCTFTGTTLHGAIVRGVELKECVRKGVEIAPSDLQQGEVKEVD
jgi:uncharacterized protein YjbI with pentapeptide repeats